MTPKSIISLCLLLLVFCGPVGGKNIDDKDIPRQLEPWKPWVLHGSEEYICQEET